MVDCDQVLLVDPCALLDPAINSLDVAPIFLNIPLCFFQKSDFLCFCLKIANFCKRTVKFESVFDGI
jgi:hypothetical protein